MRAIILLLLLAACSPAVHVDGRYTAMSLSRKAGEALKDSILTCDLDEPVPDPARLLAQVTVYSPMFWLNAAVPYPTLLDYARCATHTLGGNVFSVTGARETDISRLRVFVNVYRIPSADAHLRQRDSLRRAAEIAARNVCLVHIKSNYVDAFRRPVDVLFDDIPVGLSRGNPYSGGPLDAHFSLEKELHHPVQELDLVLDHEGDLSIREPGSTATQPIPIHRGREYYMFILLRTYKGGHDYYMQEVGKEAFDNNIINP